MTSSCHYYLSNLRLSSKIFPFLRKLIPFVIFDNLFYKSVASEFDQNLKIKDHTFAQNQSRTFNFLIFLSFVNIFLLSHFLPNFHTSRIKLKKKKNSNRNVQLTQILREIFFQRS